MAGRGVPAVQPSRVGVLRATRISATVAPLLQRAQTRGVVLATHRTTLTLDVRGRSVTIVADAAGGLPDGITVGPVFAPRELGISAGMAVACDGTSLRIAGLLRIDLVGAAIWSPVLGPCAIALPGLAARASALDEAVVGSAGRAFGGSDGSTPFRATAQPHIARLRTALFERDARAAGIAAIAHVGARLIGLGPGLTPSGDDLLVGLMATLFVLADPRARGLARAWGHSAAGATTPVAAAFHRHAAHAEFSERLHDTLRAVLEGPMPAIPAAVERALAWGATSGADTLLGIRLGLESARTTHAGRTAA